VLISDDSDTALAVMRIGATDVTHPPSPAPESIYPPPQAAWRTGTFAHAPGPVQSARLFFPP